MPSERSVLIQLLAATLLSLGGFSCDLVAGGGASDVRSGLPFLDVAMEVGGSAHVPLRLHFAADDRAGVLTFQANSDQPIVELVVVDDTMDVVAVAEGRALVTVTARSESGSEASLDVNVNVSGFACPPGPSSGEADFLPIEAQEVWTFDYAYTYRTFGFPSSSVETGVLTVSLGSPSCLHGARTVEAVEQVSGERLHWEDSTSIPDTTLFERTRTVTFTETSDGVELPWGQGTVPRYNSVGLPRVEVSGVLYDGCPSAVATMEPGALVSFHGPECHFLHGTFTSLDLQRIR